MRNSLEIQDEKNILVKRNLDILAAAKREERELTDEESNEFDENEKSIKALDDEAEELEKSLENNEEEKEENNKNIETKQMEKKNFSIVKLIRSSMQTKKPIEFRAGEPNYSVTTNGEDVVETNIYDILEPLRANLVLTAAGSHYLSNLTGDVQIPLMTATNVNWAGEVDEAADGSGTLSNITLSPKRLTAKVPITLQMLAQDSQDIEEKIMRDLVNAVADKIEATALGYAASTTTKPAGIFYNQTLTEITTYGDLCDFEADVEEANVRGKMHYIVTPKAKSYLRGLIKGTNNTGMVFDNDNIDGTPVEVTTNLSCASGNKLGVLYGNFDDLYIGTWSNLRIDIVEDSVNLAKGQIMMIVNFFADIKAARPEAFAYGKIVKPEE